MFSCMHAKFFLISLQVPVCKKCKAPNCSCKRTLVILPRHSVNRFTCKVMQDWARNVRLLLNLARVNLQEILTCTKLQDLEYFSKILHTCVVCILCIIVCRAATIYRMSLCHDKVVSTWSDICQVYIDVLNSVHLHLQLLSWDLPEHTRSWQKMEEIWANQW